MNVPQVTFYLTVALTFIGAVLAGLGGPVVLDPHLTEFLVALAAIIVGILGRVLHHQEPPPAP